MHCKSIEINRFINSYLCQHLKGNALAYITKLFLNTPCESTKGHNLDEAYTFPLNYTAKILGRSRETIRRLQEDLHALGIITVDKQSWEAYHNSKNQRTKTGMVQEVRFSKMFKAIIKRFLSKEKNIVWIFSKPAAFLKKCETKIAKAKAAKDQFLEKLFKEKKVETKTPPKKLVEDFEVLLKVGQGTNQMEGIVRSVKNRMIKDGYAKDDREAHAMTQSITDHGYIRPVDGVT